jgi:hypothetical protein
MPWKSLDQILDEFEHYSVQKKRKGRFDVLFPQTKTPAKTNSASGSIIISSTTQVQKISQYFRVGKRH